MGMAVPRSGKTGALELVWNSSMGLEYLDSSPGSYIYLTLGNLLKPSES